MSRPTLLLINVLVIAVCGLVYELVAGALASYVLGDSVTQFSTCIGVYLSAMGLGAWLSRFVDRSAARVFVEVELGVALIGGFSAPLLFAAFATGAYFRLLLYVVVLLVGTLVGLELPLLMRILQEKLDFKELVSRVLAFDYLGALLASIAFPLLLVPQLGLIRTSLVFGMANAAVGLWGTWLLRESLGGGRWFLQVRSLVVLGLLTAGLFRAESFTQWSEDRLYDRPILHAITSPYQRIVVTGDEEGFQLYLNGHLQFSSPDEYRYHEALVHPAVGSALDRASRIDRASDLDAPPSDPNHAAGSVEAAATDRPEPLLTALVLGGGDGLAVRELLRYERIGRVVLVDLDPRMTQLARDYRPLALLNDRALDDPRVEVVNDDAMIWIETADEPFDVVVIDFPDPSSYAVGKLYSRRFFRMLAKRLSARSRVAIQATSPIYTRQSFWCIVRTMESAGFTVRPYHAAVPSFGIWGFALAGLEPFDVPQRCRDDLRSLDAATQAAMFAIPPDLGPVPVEIQRLDSQILVRYHDRPLPLPRGDVDAGTSEPNGSSETMGSDVAVRE
ncbi:MAG TPA: polyamine aminopropyltransferase [Planctomycetaceae bacterium]|nr:polyamine aminopropyltransferase [Planctomycetaceae bacterium]